MYIGLMTEVKIRASALNRFIQSKPNLHGQLMKEFIYLQLRMVFEIIAIGALALQKNTSTARELEKLWHAGDVIDRLERINPHCFPRACVISRGTDMNFFVEDVDPPPLTKKEFVSLYKHCGAELHKGTLKDILGAKMSAAVSLDDSQHISKKLAQLLESHRIASADYKTHYICKMSNGSKKEVAVFTAVG
jgi:hypothetical protein